MRSIQVLVVGGGASGMMAAIMAKRAGAGVLILEKKNRLGKKLLATGNGKCNFTNYRQEPCFYRSSRTDYPWQVISQFNEKDCIAWFDELGVLAKDRDGYVYPAAGQATSVLHALEREIARLKIEVHTEESVLAIEKKGTGQAGDGFTVTTEQGKYLARKVILSVGGMAAPVHGSTGDGYSFVRNMGHTVIPPVPALTSLLLKEACVKDWSGVRVQGTVSIYDEKKKLLAQDTGEIQLVAQGISGIPVFQISRFAARKLQQKENVTVVFDAMPEHDTLWVTGELIKRQRRDGKQSMRDLLEGMFPDKLGKVYLKCLGIGDKTEADRVSEDTLQKMAELIKHMELSVRGVGDFDKAQVTCGGVATEEVDPDTMESKCCDNLYLTGELLDVDGMCGGYNLQWAWASGYLAGRHAGKGVGKKK